MSTDISALAYSKKVTFSLCYWGSPTFTFGSLASRTRRALSSARVVGFRTLGSKDSGPGLRLQDLGFRLQDLGFRLQDLGFRLQDLGLRRQDLGFRRQDLGLRLQDIGLKLGVIGG